MLEGLEISELMLSVVKRENEKLRLDSGYFAKPMLAAEALIRGYPSGNDELGPLFARFVKGVFDINAESYCDTGVPFLRILNLRNGVIDDSDLALIPEELHQIEKKTELRRGDIVFSKTAYPAASLVTLERCNTSQDTIATTLSKYGRETYQAEAIVAYLNSTIGQRLLWRQFQGNVQLHLSLDDGRKVPIPRFGNLLQAAIKSAFELANCYREAAKTEIESAGKMLSNSLGLDNWRPPNPLSYSSSRVNAFTAGRLDAEYFRPRVRELLTILGRDKQTIGQLAPIRRERFFPASTGDFDYLEIGSVRMDGTVQSETVPHKEAPSRATSYVRAGDIITSTVRPIRRLSALISPEQDGFVCSSGFVVLQPKHVAPEVLLTYLRLPVVCELMDLHTSASLYPAISEQDLLALPMPNVDAATSAAVCSAVRASQTSRQRAAELLEAAKRAVEIAIEDSETAALAYLKSVEEKPAP